VARARDDRQKDLLRPALEEIIDLGHPLVRLAREIDWGFLDRRFASVCAPGPGLPTRLVGAGPASCLVISKPASGEEDRRSESARTTASSSAWQAPWPRLGVMA
jgi:hypothetical protein